MKICPSCGLRYSNDATQCFVDRVELREASDPWIGSLIAGCYRIETVLGEGGMATVYRARHTLQDKPVAIKMFRKELARETKLRQRFFREATSTARLAHPNIIEIMDSGEAEDGTPYLVMEYLTGESLEGLLSHGPISLPRAVDIVLQTLSALARAHDFQVIHRDLKPDNLFVCRAPDGSDFVKILDFGIARSMHDPRLTGAGEVFGTPQYMAPERITSIDAGSSADLYSMGVILYELTTGRLPFEANDVTGYLLKHMREQPPVPRTINAEISVPLEALTLKLLDKDPSKRSVDAHAVVKELSAIAARMPRPKPVPASAKAAPPLAEKPAMVARPHANTLAPATVERWERRIEVFKQMLGRARYTTSSRSELSQQLDRVRENFARMASVRQRSMREQMTFEAITTRAREAQARFGRAMETLGQDLSHIREELQRAHVLEKEYAEQLKHGGGPFAAIHTRVAVAPAVPTPELIGLYRKGLEAAERIMAAEREHGRVQAYVQAKEREIGDTQFQIDELRAQVARLSQASEDERASVQKLVEQLGSEVASLEEALIRDASALANALRGERELQDLFAELGTDVA